MKQGSKEWHESRANRLTASRFASAIGVCKYTTRQKLYREYMGLDPKFEGNEATRWGAEHESDAIFEIECVSGLLVEETGFHVHPDYDWIGASPDGLINDKGCIETKCPFFKKEPHQEVPINYMAQIQGVMEVLDRDWCLFGSWTEGDSSIFKVERSKEYWGWMFPKLEAFWSHVKKGRPPKREKKEYFNGEIKIERIK